MGQDFQRSKFINLAGKEVERRSVRYVHREGHHNPPGGLERIGCSGQCFFVSVYDNNHIDGRSQPNAAGAADSLRSTGDNGNSGDHRGGIAAGMPNCTGERSTE
jgi:hypothetical protein